MNGILQDTLAELIDRKMLFIYGVISLIGGFMFWMIGSMEVNITTQGMDPAEVYEALGNPILRALNAFSYVIVFMTVMATAGLFPNMLVKGTADFFLSKPVSRTRLFLGRLFSIWVVYGSLLVVCIAFQIVVASIASDIFTIDLVYLVAVHGLGLLVWLSITALVGIISGSAGVGIMAAFGVWLGQLILSEHDKVSFLIDSELVQNIFTACYYIFPKTDEISNLALNLAMDSSVDFMPLWTSLLTAAGLIWIGTILFNRKDY